METVKEIRLVIDGRAAEAPEGSTVLAAIQHSGLYVPTLCHDPVLKPFGGCRLCIVRIDGVRGLPTACTTPAEAGMVIHTEDDEIRRLRRTIVELAVADHPAGCLSCATSQACDLLKVARYVGVRQSAIDRLRRRPVTKRPDTSNPAYDFDPNKCILCGRCVRTCDEIAGVGAIDFAHRGYDTVISPFGGQPLASSVCQTCGECVEHCPTGALSAKQATAAHREVRTVCPYCGVGCSVYLGVRGRDIVHVRGDSESPVNRGQLCVKGRFGLDFVNHPDRLTDPLIRKPGVPRTVRTFSLQDVFRRAGWDEALGMAAQGLDRVRGQDGPDAIGVLSSAKCTNEDNYLLQKFARATLGTNNVDHCARLCHSSTVAAALAAFGEGAMSNSVADIDRADLLFVIGSNTTECHPIIGRRIKRAIRNNGATLIVADPRAIELSEMAALHLSQLPGTDVALLNGIMRQIIEEGLHDRDFISERSEGFEPFQASLAPYDLKAVEGITGVSGAKIRQAAMLFGRAERAIVLYGMGITQHTTGTDNVKAIANLLMLTGNIGRPGTGFAPLRGQNNVQGACDMGALPVFYPGYQRVDDPAVRRKFEKAWGRELSDKAGLTATEMIQGAHAGHLKALYVMGENPMLSEPDLNHAREAFARLDLLIVQDIFCTETAQMADVILPAACFAEKDGTFTNTERRVQRVRQALPPPGQARGDWEIVAEVARRMGYPLDYPSSGEIVEEMRRLTPIYGGITCQRLAAGESLQWPCWDPEHPGTPLLHAGQFTRGRGKFHVVQDRPPAELPTVAYPMLLTTGRILEQFHTGSMSHRSHVLEALAADSRVELNPEDARRLGVGEGDVVSLSSRRGEVQTKVKMTRRVPSGHAFMAFHWGDAPANRLTITAFDPLAKIPEFKVSSIKAMLTVLERAAEDNKFLAALAANPAGVLSHYTLTPEHRRALVSGDIASIEEWIGPLNDRLKAWLKQRLEQENIAMI
ncbi:MAG: formate dehydrogenase subunit alpha [Thermodesulfobacteriota bacterium]